MAPLKYVPPYKPFKSYGGLKHAYIALKARLAPNSIGHRRELGLLLNAQGLTGQGAEIGVKEGKFSERILHYWRGQLLYSVDPWLEFGDEYRDASNVKQAEQDDLYLETQTRLARFGSRNRILRTTSIEAAKLIPDDSLDFVFLDAQHHYEAVREDIALWWPKVRRGGILSGHDYVNGSETDSSGTVTVFGVRQAVDEFVQANRVKLFITTKDKRPSWFMRKK